MVNRSNEKDTVFSEREISGAASISSFESNSSIFPIASDSLSSDTTTTTGIDSPENNVKGYYNDDNNNRSEDDDDDDDNEKIQQVEEEYGEQLSYRHSHHSHHSHGRSQLERSTSRNAIERVPSISIKSISSKAQQIKKGLSDWLQVFGAFLLLVNSWGWYGVFKTFYNLDLLRERSLFNIAWIGSIHMFLVTVIGIFVSNRMVQAGYTKAAVIISSIIITFGMMMISLSTEYYQILLSQGFVMGIGCAFSTSAAVPTVNAYFTPDPNEIISSHSGPKSDSEFKISKIERFQTWYFKYRKSFAVGICSSGAAIGGIIYPSMGLQLISKITFPTTAKIIGGLIFVTLITAAFLLNPLPNAPPHGKWRWASHRNFEGSELSFAKSISSFFAVSTLLIDWTAFRDVKFLLFAFGSMIFNAGLYVPIFFISQFGIEYGASLQYAFYLLPVLNSGSFIGRALPPIMSQVLGPLNAITVSICFCVTIGFAWLAVETSARVALFAVFYGLISGSFIALPNACLAAMSPSPELAPKRVNLGAIIGAMGILIGPPMGGLLIKSQFPHFFHTQIYSGILMASGGVLMIAARLTLTGGKIFVKV